MLKRTNWVGLGLALLVVFSAMPVQAQRTEELPTGWLVYSDSLLRKINLTTGEVATLTPESEWSLAYEPAYHPETGFIAFAGSRKGETGTEIWIIHPKLPIYAASPTKGKTLLGQEFFSRDPLWGPEGELYFLGALDGWGNQWPHPNMVCSVSSGQAPIEVEVGASYAYYSSLTFGPEGLTVEAPLGWFVVTWDETGESWNSLLSGRYPNWASGKLAYSSVHNDALCIMENGQSTCFPKPESTAAVIDPALSPDGKWLAFSGLDPEGGREGWGVYNLWIMNIATGEFRQITDTDSNDRNPAWLD